METLDIHALNSLIHLFRALIITGLAAVGVGILCTILKTLMKG